MWRYIHDGPLPGPTNMAIDEALLVSSLIPDQTGFIPTLRFYAWEPPTLSLGHAQNFDQSVDPEYCRKAGIGIVRRITGGLAVLHDDELTYAVVPGPGGLKKSPGILETYKRISEALLLGLKYYGVAASLVQKQKAERRSPAPNRKAAPCFAVQTKYEIAAEGKKLIGSAQRRMQKSFLQHGSVPFTLDREMLLRATNSRENGAMEMFTSLGEIKGRRVNRETLIKALIRGFGDYFGVDLRRGELSDAEKALASELKEKKYSLDAWNEGTKRERMGCSSADILKRFNIRIRI